MKYSFTLLIMIWAFLTNAQNHLNPIESLLAKDTQPLRNAKSQPLKTGDGKISGQLFDLDTNELIENGFNLNVNLFKKHPRFDDWLFIERTDAENAAFEFSQLEYGQYVLFVSNSSFFEIESGERDAYLNATWSVSGSHTCINCNINSDKIITLGADQNQVQADITVEKGGVLVVYLAADGLEQINNFRIVAINENNQVFNNSIQVTSINGTGLIPPATSTEIKTISILPAGNYKFYTDTYEFIDKTNEGIVCEYCEFQTRQSAATPLTVIKSQITETSIVLTKPNSSVSGRIDSIEPINGIGTRLFNYNYRHQFFANVFDEPFEFVSERIHPGIYFLNTQPFIDNNSTETNLHYPSLYGGGFCDGINCDLTAATPILVTTNQNIKIQPYTLPIGGGVISGSVKGSEDVYLLDSSGFNTIFGADYFEFYDENHMQVSQKGVSTFVDLLNNAVEFSRSLPAGRYYVKTGSSRNGESNRNYVDQLYPGINCAGFYCDFSQAELITVVAGETVTGIDFNLEKGYGVRGNVTEKNTGNDLKDINILVYDQSFNLLGSTKSDDNGDFSFFNLPNGDYYVRTANGSQSFKNEYQYAQQGGFLDQLYPNIGCTNGLCELDLGQKISVQDNDVTNINFELSKGTALNGIVTDSKTGQPIEHLTVGLYQPDGTHIGNYKTNHLGAYATGALQAGDYLIKTQEHNLYPEFVLGSGICLYGGCDINTGTAIDFNDQQVNFDLIHKKDAYAAFSGNWYQPTESGHGFQFEVINQNDASHLYVTWFAHLNDKPIWLTGTGLLLGNKAYVDLYITDGLDFPNSMNIEYWGKLQINFADLNHASISWQPVLPEFSDGELEIERLTVLSSEYTTDGSIGACFSGSYYDPVRNGEGMVVEALGNPTNQLVITWYSYRGEEQFWMIGTGAINDNKATFEVNYSEGSSFTPDFNSNDLENIVWGEVGIERIDDLTVRVDFRPNAAHSDFETKQTTLTKLTEIHTLSCQNK